ncbi:MAG: copper chaperone PCu(A)C [Gammaproteobacteria bacterium]
MKTKNLPFHIALLTALCLCTAATAATLDISHAWVREAPPASKVLAAYMAIRNPGDAVISISGISSPDFESAELHRTVVSEGMARMLHIKQLEIPAKGTVMLEPGGLHLMLFNPSRPLAAGDRVTLTLHLSNDICLTLDTPVIRRADDGQTHQHH